MIRFYKNTTTHLRQITFANYSVRLRYAPSPTGFMHIGGLRTALLNYLYARKHQGQFIIRIEDTDRARLVQGSTENIFDALNWIGITPNQSIKNGGPHQPYIQSQRLSIYKEIQKNLLKNGIAYPCFCDHEPGKKNNHEQSFLYDGKCKKLTFQEIKTRIKNKQPYAVRIKGSLIEMPKYFSDQVFGQINFKSVDDFVIVKRDGWPTFHFANVIDDWKMEITHVMRGEEWLTNTNKHIYLYHILGIAVPKFVHLPIVKSMAGKKLAKRDPMSSVEAFKCYQVEAVKNFLFQLGVHLNQKKQKAQEEQLKKDGKQDEKGSVVKGQINIFTEEQMISQFQISKISRVSNRFDIKQLNHLNRQVLKKKWAQINQSQTFLTYFISKCHQYIPSSLQYPNEYIIKAISCFSNRLQLISNLENYKYYFEEPNYFTDKSKIDFQKLYSKGSKLIEVTTIDGTQLRMQISNSEIYSKNKKIIHNLRIILEHVISPSEYSAIDIAKRISEYLCQAPNLKNEEVFHLLRYIVSGSKSGPGIVQACVVIGRQKILKRIARFSDL